ncbi:MAG TPA: hypothetical protein VGC07_05575 [Granulicella sp.]
MTFGSLTRSLLCTASILALAGAAQAQQSVLAPGTTLPIVFPHKIDGAHAHVGDVVEARTTEAVPLASGGMLPRGARISGHVVQSGEFHFNTAHYAVQQPATLAIAFDAVTIGGESVPVHVTVRALADALTTWDAQRPLASDMDPTGTTTQIGGDQVTPRAEEVLSRDGDIVGYKRGSDVYAHLISSGSCPGSTTEQAVGLFSASACGLYGFEGVSLRQNTNGSFELFSSHYTPKIWRSSVALLQVE